MKIKIVAFTGLPMTGKSTAREILQKLLDDAGIPQAFVHFGSTEEVTRRDAEHNWTEEEAVLTQAKKEQLIRERWRAESGMGVMAEKMLPTIKEQIDSGKIIVVENLYSDEERTVLKQAFGADSLVVVALAADWNVRVRRGANRPERPLSEAELRERDEAEIYNLHKGPAIALADFTIANNINETTNQEATRELIKNALKERVLPVITA